MLCFAPPPPTPPTPTPPHPPPHTHTHMTLAERPLPSYRHIPAAPLPSLDQRANALACFWPPPLHNWLYDTANFSHLSFSLPLRARTALPPHRG